MYSALIAQLVNELKEFAQKNGKTNFYVWDWRFHKIKSSTEVAFYLCKLTGIHTWFVDNGELSLDFSDGLLINPLNKTHIFLRNYRKYDIRDINKSGDYFPLINLSESEVNDIFTEITSEKELNSYFGFSLRDIEWAQKEDNRTYIVSGEKDPTKYSHYINYTIEQRKIISFLWAREKKTRHKKFEC